MQGDIKEPRFDNQKPAPKPKPMEYNTGQRPDIEISDQDLEAPEAKRSILKSPHKHFKRFWNFWLGLNRLERSALVLGILLIIGAGTLGYIYFLRPDPAPPVVHAAAKPKPKPPTTVPSPLTGLPIDPALAKRPVTGIMIENSVYARPQSGLQDAGVVYEAVAEGGITRFMSLFQDAQPQYIGPVRSLRPYYIDFAAPFQASIVHVGGSPDALGEVRSGNYRDLDQFFNSGAFSRVSTRAAPHNVYTSFAKLDSLNQAKGFTSSLYTTWPRKADKKIAVPTAKTIDLAISGPDFYVHYDYDAASNSYMRSEGGAPHMELVSADDKTGVRLHPKTVIALVMAYSIAGDGQHSIYQDNGSGTAYIFQDGGATVGTWEKTDTASQISFKDDKGLPIKLNAGQVWLTLVGGSNKVTYKP
ncbi:MAG TPA: DUF3048 domain-containing protein [Candidatus Babeliales bacterium]|nr:DUF3048 domain-containing protein [Candidatus Babeliales bacterium]